MGRRQLNIDNDLMLDLITSGMSSREIAETMGVSIPTLESRIKELQNSEKALLAYDKVHHLGLIAVQQKLIDGVTDEKITAAPLGQIAQAYGVFNKAKQLATGGPTEIQGLMGYLIALETEDRNASTQEPIDVTPESKSEEPEQMSLF